MKKFIVPLFAIAILVLFGFSISIFQLEITQPIDMINSWGADTTYHQQTEALAHGHLSLGPSIQGLLHDAAFFNGVQLSFGIGPALLRLPIEALAAALGFERVPDKLIFYFYFCVLFYLLFRVLKTHLHFDGPQALSVASLAMCLPIISQLVGVRFAGYEEAVAYLFLGGIAAVICLLWYQYSKKMIALAAFVFTNSSLVLFRATGALYAVALIAAFAVFYLREISAMGTLNSESGLGILARFNFFSHPKSNRLALGFVLAGILPPFLLLVLNKIKFGGFLEFGHNFVTSGEPINDYLLKFANTYKTTNLWSAILDLWGSLFLSPAFNDFHFYMSGLHPFQAKALRFREFYFQTFSVTDFLVFLTALLLVLDSKQKTLSRFFGLSSLISFLLMFAFYLYTPGITSRYVADFSLSFTLAVIAISIAVISRLKPEHFLLFSMFLWLSFGTDAFEHNSSIDSVFSSQGKTWSLPLEFESTTDKKLRELLRSIPVELPSSYDCHDKKWRTELKIINNGAHWNRKSCRVAQVLSLYFKYNKCVVLSFSPQSEADLEKIPPRVKYANKTLPLVQKVAEAETLDYTYCTNPEELKTLENHPVGPVFVSFTDDAHLKQRPKIKLLKISMKEN